MRVQFREAEVFRGTRVLRQEDDIAYAYETRHSAADADGAPNAYHPADLGKHCQRDQHVGLDCLGNAGYPNSTWWDRVLVPDPDDRSRAYTQRSGPYSGFFVAMTALRAPRGDRYDPATYADSRVVPYVVVPTGFERLPNVAGQGDVGIAQHVASGRMTTFIVADAGGGNDAQLGEASIALYSALGFPNSNPRTGAGLPRDDILYVLFPGSRRNARPVWPRSNAQIHDQAMELARITPGIEL